MAHFQRPAAPTAQGFVRSFNCFFVRANTNKRFHSKFQSQFQAQVCTNCGKDVRSKCMPKCSPKCAKGEYCHALVEYNKIVYRCKDCGEKNYDGTCKNPCQS